MLVKIKGGQTSIDCWLYLVKKDEFVLHECIERNKNDKALFCFEAREHNDAIFYKVLLDNKQIVYLKKSDNISLI